MSIPPPHEMVGPSGIVVPDPDQGTPYIALQCAMPSTMLMVYEPFEDGTKGGHNLYGFLRRWHAWEVSEEPFLQAIEPRFGFPIAIPRSALVQVIQIGIAYHRKEDVRAGVRGSSLAVPGGPAARQLADGSIEIRVPR
jgi:hypothetical protein